MGKMKLSRPTAPVSKKPAGLVARAVKPLLGSILFVAVIVSIYLSTRRVVEREYTLPPMSPRVELVNRPIWMSDALARQIIDLARPTGIHSAFDQLLLEQTARALAKSPWIKEVTQVRRVYKDRPADTLDVTCVFRTPTALVRWQDYYWLVDGEGFKLPAQYTREEARQAMVGPDSRLSLRVIEGVMHDPVETGVLWPGDDLAAGLDMARLLDGQPWSDQLPIIDVSNFEGRRDPAAAHILLWTTNSTTIRWGRAPSARDAFVEVPTARKLDALTQIFNQTQRVDGNKSWIDVRFDKVTYPTPAPEAGAAGDQ